MATAAGWRGLGFTQGRKADCPGRAVDETPGGGADSADHQRWVSNTGDLAATGLHGRGRHCPLGETVDWLIKGPGRVSRVRSWVPRLCLRHQAATLGSGAPDDSLRLDLGSRR